MKPYKTKQLKRKKKKVLKNRKSKENIPIKFLLKTILLAECNPPLCSNLTKSVENIKVTNIKMTDVSTLGGGCKLISNDAFTEGVKKKLIEEAKKPVEVKCKNCNCIELIKFDKKKVTIERKGLTVYLDRDGDEVPKDDAACKIDFDLSFDGIVSGPVGLCIP